MEITKEPLYVRGYIAGYWDGVNDAASGRILDGQSAAIGKLPVRAMGLSTRVCNCLIHGGCTHVEDLIALNSDDIMRMRNVGQKTAREIARWLTEHGVLCSAWTEFL